MAAPKPSDVAADHEARKLRQKLGRFADDYADVRRIFACLQTDLRADRVLNPHIAALLTIAVVLHHQPEEEEL